MFPRQAGPDFSSFDNVYDSRTQDTNCERTVISEIMQAIEEIRPDVQISVKVSWLQPSIIPLRALEALTCISRLELCMLPKPRPPMSFFDRDLRYDYMGFLAQVLHKNPRIREFHLVLKLSRYGQPFYDEYHNVPLIGHSCFRQLQVLHLEGDLAFEPEDWVRWDACLNWTKLRTLRLVHRPLILQVLTHCSHRLPNLYTLQLRMHRKDTEQEKLVPLLEETARTIIGDFLSSTTVTEIDLTDFTRDIPLTSIVQGSGARLQKLRLHVNLHKQTRSLHIPGQVAGRPANAVSTELPELYWGETAFLGPEKLDHLNITCPYLKQFGLDVEELDGSFPVKHGTRYSVLIHLTSVAVQLVSRVILYVS